MTVRNMSGSACRLLPLVVIAGMSLTGCTSGKEAAKAEATPVGSLSFAAQQAYVSTVRASQKALYATPEIPISQQIAIITSTCKVIDHIAGMPAEAAMFALVYCP
jgi:hypothetical protein